MEIPVFVLVPFSSRNSAASFIAENKLAAVIVPASDELNTLFMEEYNHDKSA